MRKKMKVSLGMAVFLLGACGPTTKHLVVANPPNVTAESALPSEESPIAIVAGVLSGAIASTDSSTARISSGASDSIAITLGLRSVLAALLAPFPVAAADVPLCQAANLGAKVTGAVSGDSNVALLLSGCRKSFSDGTWNGSENLAFDSLNTITAYQGWNPAQLLSSGQVVRTFGGSIGSMIGALVLKAPSYRVADGGTNLIFADTQSADMVCFKNAVGCPKQTGIKTAFMSSNSSQVRVLSISGIRLASAGSLKATVSSWDDVLASEPIVVMDVGNAKTVLPSGNIRVFHNTTGYMSVSRVTQPLAWNVATAPSNCHPSSGQITNTCLAGNDETLTFIGGGSATHVDCGGMSSVIKLKHCF